MIALENTNRRDLAHDLLLPMLLFAALGGMTWAVRGCSGFGGSDGCIFAGVMWGAAWWFIARDAGAEQSRRYSSAWIILAVTVGVGFSGNRGWMQWSNFFLERMYTNAGEGEFVHISRAYGFLWLFIAIVSARSSRIRARAYSVSMIRISWFGFQPIALQTNLLRSSWIPSE